MSHKLFVSLIDSDRPSFFGGTWESAEEQLDARQLRAESLTIEHDIDVFVHTRLLGPRCRVVVENCFVLRHAGRTTEHSGGWVTLRPFERPDMLREDRKQLVGLLTDNPAVVLREGAQIVAPDAPEPRPGQKVPMQGHVTSSYFSPTLDRSIALALVKGGRARIGQQVKVPVMGRQAIAARITAPIFHDDKGEAARA